MITLNMPLCHSQHFLPMRSVQMWLFKLSLSRNPTDPTDVFGSVFYWTQSAKCISPYFLTMGVLRLWAAPTRGEWEMDKQGKPWTPSSSCSGRIRNDQMGKRINKYIKQHWAKLRHGEGLCTEAEGLAHSEGQIHRGNSLFHASSLTQRKRIFLSP